MPQAGRGAHAQCGDTGAAGGPAGFERRGSCAAATRPAASKSRTHHLLCCGARAALKVRPEGEVPSRPLPEGEVPRTPVLGPGPAAAGAAGGRHGGSAAPPPPWCRWMGWVAGGEVPKLRAAAACCCSFWIKRKLLWAMAGGLAPAGQQAAARGVSGGRGAGPSSSQQSVLSFLPCMELEIGMRQTRSLTPSHA